jgi:hypothetical protein
VTAEPKPLAIGDVKRNEDGEPLLCVYPEPCVGMEHHTVSRGSGIHQLDNRIVLSDPKWRPFHMGFALKPSPHPEVGKRGVLLNFCPWCGSDLRAWLAAYQADIDAHKAMLKAEHESAGETGLAMVDDAKPAKISRKAVKA